MSSLTLFSVSQVGDVTVAKLTSKLSIITPVLIAELNSILDTVRGPSAAFVLHNEGGVVFSAGLDLKGLGSPNAAAYIQSFQDLLTRLRTAPFPTFVFASGKVIAGGYVFASVSLHHYECTHSYERTRTFCLHTRTDMPRSVFLFCCFDYRFILPNVTFYVNEVDNGFPLNDLLISILSARVASKKALVDLAVMVCSLSRIARVDS